MFTCFRYLFLLIIAVGGATSSLLRAEKITAAQIQEAQDKLVSIMVLQDILRDPEIAKAVEEYHKLAKADVPWVTGKGIGYGVGGALMGAVLVPALTALKTGATCKHSLGIAALAGFGLGGGSGFAAGQFANKKEKIKAGEFDVEATVANIENNPEFKKRLDALARSIRKTFNLDITDVPALSANLKKEFIAAVRRKEAFNVELALRRIIPERKFKDYLSSLNSLSNFDQLAVTGERAKNVFKFGKRKQLNILNSVLEAAKRRKSGDVELDKAIQDAEVILELAGAQ